MFDLEYRKTPKGNFESILRCDTVQLYSKNVHADLKSV